MKTILALWTWHPSVIIGCIGLVVGYLLLVSFRPARKFIIFLLGVLVLLITLESPLDALGDTYLFSAHMIQHQLLVLAVPPLLLIGLPAEATFRWRNRLSLAAESAEPAVLAVLSWLVGVETIWAWHLPALYNAALADERIHLLEHLSFLLSSTVFWWPVLSPWKEPGELRARLPLLASAAYLVLAAVACDVFGTILAYSEPGLYPAYLKPTDPFGILPLLRDQWQISPSADQQAGGLLMSITGDLVYIPIALWRMAGWYRSRLGKNRIG